ncbi:MAG: winged helix-turn-helix transcriptional regulator [Acidimicrobiia bacterium]|nr:winged helix-turn-helix transcriptional regulator [Acidimicrobiia bacterium]
MKMQRPEELTRFADQFAALGAEPRLRIVRLLLAAHPEGMVVGDIQNELGMAGSTLSHHLDKLKNEELVEVRRDRQFLWYRANTEALTQLLGFLWAECCTRNAVISTKEILQWKPASSGKT